MKMAQAPTDNHWRVCSLCAALGLYGTFSSPTPDNPGIAEAVIGLCLLIAIGRGQLLAWGSGLVLWQGSNWRDWLGAYLLFIPSIIAILNGVTVAEMIRDLIPMGYTLLPLLIIGLPKTAWRPIATALFICGALLSLRYWFITDSWPLAWRHLKAGDNYLYIPLEPAVLFTACLGPIWCLQHLLQEEIKPLKLKDYFLILMAIYCTFLAMGALAGLLMRAALALAVCAWLVYGVYALRHHKKVLVMLGALGILLLIIWQPEILNRLWTRLTIKTEAVGINARSEEFNTVLSAVGDHPVSFLFGQGWGSKLISPAVGNTAVHYTHSMISYLWAKSGLIGVIAMLAYLISILNPLRCMWRRQTVVIAAVISPLALAVTLYTSYKYLTFGILLLLIQLLVDAYPISQSGRATTARSNRPITG